MPRNIGVQPQRQQPQAERQQVLQHGLTETNLDYAVQRGLSLGSILELVTRYGPMAVQIINGVMDAFRQGDMPSNQPPQPGAQEKEREPQSGPRQSWDPEKEKQAQPPVVEQPTPRPANPPSQKKD